MEREGGICVYCFFGIFAQWAFSGVENVGYDCATNNVLTLVRADSMSNEHNGCVLNLHGEASVTGNISSTHCTECCQIYALLCIQTLSLGQQS